MCIRDRSEYTYPLSTYGTVVENGVARAHSWNWTLDETVTGEDVGTHYHFYEFVNQPANIQKEGIINWDDPNNTLKESESSTTSWEGEGGIVDRMIEFELRKHLDLFTTDKYIIPVFPTVKFGVTDTGLSLGGQYNLGKNIYSTFIQKSSGDSGPLVKTPGAPVQAIETPEVLEEEITPGGAFLITNEEGQSTEIAPDS